MKEKIGKISTKTWYIHIFCCILLLPMVQKAAFFAGNLEQKQFSKAELVGVFVENSKLKNA